MTFLTVIYTYYGQKERIADIVAEKHPSVRVVIVDDHSPEPLEPIEGIDIYRIDDDINWNQGGARNLGASVSEGWLVFADMDYLITRKTADKIINMVRERDYMYPLGRRNKGVPQALFVIHKDDFERIGGYDEDFSGRYGYEDVLFNTQARHHVHVIERRDIKVKLFTESIVKDLDRERLRNYELYLTKKDEPSNTGERFRFKWHKL
jgi:hypothetical protein